MLLVIFLPFFSSLKTNRTNRNFYPTWANKNRREITVTDLLWPHIWVEPWINSYCSIHQFSYLPVNWNGSMPKVPPPLPLPPLTTLSSAQIFLFCNEPMEVPGMRMLSFLPLSPCMPYINLGSPQGSMGWMDDLYLYMMFVKAEASGVMFGK